MSKDADYRRMIHTTRWLRLRWQVLTEHPGCEACEKEGYVTAASEVHHRRPVESAADRREKERLMFDLYNLMALCHRCHVEIHKAMGKGGKDEHRRRTQARIKEFNEKFFGNAGNNN